MQTLTRAIDLYQQRIGFLVDTLVAVDRIINKELNHEPPQSQNV